ncbi:MAG: response regulator transcription factor [Pseudomonadota bacterium]|nr:response regulator transcription factor [Pseudomonadota bacterium]
MTRLLVADDHPIILSGLKAVLRGSGFEVVAVESDGARVVEAVERVAPDIVVLDLRMPNRDGVELAEELRRRGDTRPIVLLTAGIGDEALLRALEAGVNAIVLKDRSLDRLIQCLSKVRSGGRWIDEGLLQRALDLKLGGGPAKTGFSALSPREQMVARLVAEGRRNREIADALGISEGTVKVHLYKIYDKLGVGNRTELAILTRKALAP